MAIQDSGLALDHLRILDLGIITAGAATSQMLGDFGADVIKVESLSYFDPFRRWSQVASTGGANTGLDASPPFQTVNRNKRGVALDLKTPDGKATFLELVATADVIVENFRRGVLERLGLGFEVLKAAKPDIVLASLSSQGNEGDEAGYASFGSTLEALGGLMSVMGYDAETPRWTGTNVNYPDQLVSILAPGAILAALRHRDTTGEAVHLDFSQRECVSFLLGEHIVGRASGAPLPAVTANRHPVHAPQGVYPAVGVEQWVALTIRSDREWSALCEVLGAPDLSADIRFLSVEGRREHHAEIDGQIAKWTRDKDRDALAELLKAAGIAASPVLDASEVLHHPHLADLDFFQTLQVHHLGQLRQRGFAGRLSSTPGSLRRPAPKLGEHTGEVITEARTPQT